MRITGGGKTALEADAAGLAVEQFKLKGLGQVRSVQDAEQDPDWQHELQQLRSAGHDLPAPVQPQPEPPNAQHAFQVCVSILCLGLWPLHVHGAQQLPAADN